MEYIKQTFEQDTFVIIICTIYHLLLLFMSIVTGLYLFKLTNSKSFEHRTIISKHGIRFIIGFLSCYLTYQGFNFNLCFDETNYVECIFHLSVGTYFVNEYKELEN